MDWRRWASIARLSIRKKCCLNGSRKLLTQKIIRVDEVTAMGISAEKSHPGPECFYHELKNLRI